MNPNFKLRLILSLLGGIFMGLTPAPFGAWPLAWIALVPLWILIVKSQKSEKTFQFILYPLLWGIGYHGLALSWIIGLHPLTWLGIPWILSLAIALAAWVLFILWGSALVITWAVSSRTIFRFIYHPKSPISNALIRVLIGTSLWCIIEFIWSCGPFWWTSLSFTQSPHNLAILHLGQLSGPSTITAAIVVVNGLLTEAWIANELQNNYPKFPIRLHQALFSIVIALLLTFHLIGWGMKSQPLIEPKADALKVGIIQGNIPNQIKFTPEGLRRSLSAYTNGYRILAQHGVEAVLTPEGALSSLWNDPPPKNNPFYQAILEEGKVAWVGAHLRNKLGITNSLFTVTGTGKIESRYDKVHLVAFGEYIPFEQIFGGIIKALSAIGASQVPGLSNQIFETPFGRAIVGICYDSAFTRHFQRQAAAGGQFILTSSNNDPYSPAMQFQHHAQDILRAIETDRWAVRATNTGYSAIVDPHGRTKWISGTKTYEIHADTIYRRQTQTLYVRWGDWLTPLLLLLATLTVFRAVAIAFQWARFQSNRPTND